MQRKTVVSTLIVVFILAASLFPKNRETRAPLVSELIPHKDELDAKYHFLLDAPQQDPDGRAFAELQGKRAPSSRRGEA